MAQQPKLPPRWFIRSAWVAHKALLRVTGDRPLHVDESLAAR